MLLSAPTLEFTQEAPFDYVFNTDIRYGRELSGGGWHVQVLLSCCMCVRTLVHSTRIVVSSYVARTQRWRLARAGNAT